MRLIDADALKADYGMKDDCKDCEKEIQGYVRECHYNAVYTKMDFCEWIDSAPTIEPERKKGYWILSDYQVKEDTDNGNYRYYCSNCSHADIHARTVDVPYCWYCGAKMEEGD